MLEPSSVLLGGGGPASLAPPALLQPELPWPWAHPLWSTQGPGMVREGRDWDLVKGSQPPKAFPATPVLFPSPPNPYQVESKSLS